MTITEQQKDVMERIEHWNSTNSISMEDETAISDYLLAEVSKNSRINQSTALNLGMTLDELQTDAMAFLLLKIKDFDPSKASLSTWVERYTSYFIGKMFKEVSDIQSKIPRQKMTQFVEEWEEALESNSGVSYDEVVDRTLTPEQKGIGEEFMQLVQDRIQSLPKIAQDIFNLKMEGFGYWEMIDELKKRNKNDEISWNYVKYYKDKILFPALKEVIRTALV